MSDIDETTGAYKGWFEHYKEIWQKQVGGVDAPKSVYQFALWLPTFVNRRTLDAYPAQDSVAAFMDRTQTTVSHSVAWLEQHRRLFVRRKFSDGGRKETNRYTLIIHIGNRLTADPRDTRIAEKFIWATYKKRSRDAKIYMRTSEGTSELTSILTRPADAVRRKKREFEEARDGRIVPSADSLKPVGLDGLCMAPGGAIAVAPGGAIWMAPSMDGRLDAVAVDEEREFEESRTVPSSDSLLDMASHLLGEAARAVVAKALDVDHADPFEVRAALAAAESTEDLRSRLFAGGLIEQYR